MFKSKIAVKLSLNFILLLFVFSIMIGVAFFWLFSGYNIDMHREQLEVSAKAIASAMSDDEQEVSEEFGGGWGKGWHGMGMDSNAMSNSSSSMMGNSSMYYEAYIRFVSETMGTDIWIVDENLNLNTGRMGMGQGGMGMEMTCSDLPQNSEEIIDEVMRGETVFSENFSEVLSQTALTVGVPIYESGEIIGAVLVHSPIEDSHNPLVQVVNILLICIIIALVFSLILSGVLSMSFTKPLSKMKSVALKLADNDYSEKCSITQKDEIGDLSLIIDDLSDRLLTAQKEREKLEQLRKDYVANVSHELRTPITVLKGSLEALCDNVVNEPLMVEEYHNNMLSETKHLERLVGDLLEISRLQNTDFSLEMCDVEVSEVLKDSLRSITPIANKKDISFAVDIRSDLSLLADYGRLRQMFIIVLDNAVKFSKSSAKVEVSFLNNIVTIRDYGRGISDDELPYIFDKFYKTKDEHNANGTGLGLVIAKEVASRHNIKLTASNAVGGGVEFSFKMADNCDRKDTLKT